MSIIIKGMEMPYGCANCPFVSGPVYGSDGRATYFCKVDVEGVRGNNVTTEVIALYEGATEAFPRFCPLVELQPHGRLIDGDVAEVITYTNESGDFADGIIYAADWIADQPTIIEADEEQTTVCSATDCKHNVGGVCKKNAEEVSE